MNEANHDFHLMVKEGMGQNNVMDNGLFFTVWFWSEFFIFLPARYVSYSFPMYVSHKT